jgi:uncharacterized protein (TIGR03437 family)
MKTLLLFCLATTAAAQLPGIYSLEGATPAAVATDPQGNIYVVGQTSSPAFPVTSNALQATLKGNSDAFISKISPAGALLWSTYFGGSGNDSAAGVAIDSAGNILVAGTTSSTDLPVLNAYQNTLGGRTNLFVLKLDPTGKILYCTYLGGSSNDGATGLAVDSAGAAYITGYTSSANFPGQTTLAFTFQGFVVKLAANGALVYSYEPTNAQISSAAIAVDASGSAYITGSLDYGGPNINQAFVLKLSSDGSRTVYESNFGGSRNNSSAAIAIDSTGAAYVAGATTSVDFPLVSPVQSTLGSRPLWKSTDGGNTWTPIDNLRFAAVEALVANPTNPQNLYAAASDTGAFKSTDGGNTWTAIGNGITEPFLYQMALNPSNPSVLYAGGVLLGGGLPGEVYRTVDGGADWSLVDSFTDSLTQLAVDPQKPTTVYAISPPPTTILNNSPADAVSTDGGNTWNPLTAPAFGINQFLVDPITEGSLYAYTYGILGGLSGFVNPKIFIVFFSTLYRSTNGGVSWQTANVTPTAPGPIADPTTKPATIYAGIGARSNDGGNTWTPLTPPPGIAYSNAMATDPQTGALYAVGEPPNGPLTLDVSNNQGQSWTQLNLPSGMPGITGITPTTGALYAWNNLTQPSAFVLKFSPDGSTILYSTYLGGHGGTQATGIALDAAGNMVVAGFTQSPDFPTVKAAQPALAGSPNAFLSVISPDGQTIDYSTYLGGTKADEAAAVAVDPQGNLIVTGSASSTSILGTAIPQAGNSGFVAKFTVATPVAAPVITQVLSAASFQAPIEAGSWVMIQGTNLANDTRVWQTSDFTGNNLPVSLDGVSVTIDGKPAFVEYISPTQINVQAPSDSATGAVNVVVTNNGLASAPATAQLQAVAPALFMTPAYHAIASVLPGYTPVTATAPAMPGDFVVLWGTGFGPTNPSTSAGTIVSGAPVTATPAVVTVGGIQVPVVSSILATGNVGLYQITIQLPANVPTGTPAVQASVGGVSTQSGVTIFIGAQ